MTNNEIKDRMLSKIDDEYDTSEGTFFNDIIGALAIELESAYENLEEILEQGFVESAEGKYLDKKVKEKGLLRKPPIKAKATIVISGVEGAMVEQGMKVSSDIVNFTIMESKRIDSSGNVTVLAECDQEGSVGNLHKGAIKYFPITIQGLDSVTNPESISNGYDGEVDDELRKRYYDKVRIPATSGNKAHYSNWAMEVPGVGDVRVIPLWDGKGTVKVVIIDSEKTGAEEALVNMVHKHIEKNRPIGATVTTISATEIPVNIGVRLIIDELNFTKEQVKETISENIRLHLKEIAFKDNIVSHARLGSIILQSGGVKDYKNLLVNDKNAGLENPNIDIGYEEVAVVGVITIE
ncbi:baseplate J/gp47 family protein [Clostridiaceae bacterium M8S5]|nr:baseplate J/gp47 family protein [Clostridiaceae bacterium M8S5]